MLIFLITFLCSSVYSVELNLTATERKYCAMHFLFRGEHKPQCLFLEERFREGLRRVVMETFKSLHCTCELQTYFEARTKRNGISITRISCIVLLQ